ncbi:synaptotagmin-6-like [Patiria miniata]|uniref:C2 domain-containing protein n=1 Tax=Patiria miniata TaxID=46514 RepID=A0A914BNJ1_PATMI|nr:synaptotagmin-6-like [Patiria miniata]XP_038077053.1 synaptotagmin-6-like [Patiria miniata]
MSWEDLPEWAKLLICALVGAALMILILVVMCQCLWFWKKVKKKEFRRAESPDASDKELTDIAPHRHLPKKKPPSAETKKWETQSMRSRTSLSSSASEGYGSMKGFRHQPSRKRESKRSASQSSADLPPLDEIQFLQVHEIIPEPGTLGAVTFSLSHEKEGEKLRIGVISARDLKARPFVGGAPNPYVNISLFKSGSEKPEFKSKTKIHSKTNSPQFDQAFETAVKTSSLSRHTLRLVVCDHHRLGQSEILGEAEFRLKGVDWSTGIEEELSLEPSTQIPYGELLVSLSYLPTSERLYITVLRATGFSNVHEPSTKVSLILSGKSALRRRVSSSQQRTGLVFHEALFFETPRDKLERIRILIVVTAAAEEEKETTESVQSRSHAPPPVVDEPDIDGALEPPAQARREIGQIILGKNCAHNAHAHWEEMTLMPRVPIAQWYPIFQDIIE